MKTDWEVELGVVIGRLASYVDEMDALDYVVGYCVINDVSEREYQLERGARWDKDKGKGYDTFSPIGPLAGDARGSAKPAEPGPVARRQR